VSSHPQPRGRPTTGPEPRTVRTTVRLSEAERALVDAAAERDRRTLADWMRLTLLDAAKPPPPGDRGRGER
jgi:hypothetical protein